MTRSLTDQYTLQKRLALFASCLCVALFISYTYLLCAAVTHVVVRTDIDRAVQRERSYVSALEADFIEAQHAVSSNIAAQSGYERVNNKIFVERGAPSLVLNVPTTQP